MIIPFSSLFYHIDRQQFNPFPPIRKNPDERVAGINASKDTVFQRDRSGNVFFSKGAWFLPMVRGSWFRFGCIDAAIRQTVLPSMGPMRYVNMMLELERSL